MNIDINQGIFRAYDIRGIYDEDLTYDVVYRISVAISNIAIVESGNRDISFVIAKDGRNSGEILLDAISKGIRAGGCNVINIGEVPTPVLYFATHIDSIGTNYGIMLTGSHNPPEYNGMKIIMNGLPIYGDGIIRIYDYLIKGINDSYEKEERKQNIENEYIDRICSDIRIQKKMKIVIDCGNGVAGKIAPTLFRKLGCDVTELFCDIDGNFPNHHPDPSVQENMRILVDTVLEKKADIGLAFDGDADRVGIVLDSGEIIQSDRLLMYLVKDVLRRHNGSIVPFDVKCSSNLPKIIEESGGIPMMTRSGHSYIKSTMIEQKAQIAGEMSGHIFYKDRWYGFDDGIYSATRFLELASMENSPMSIIFSKIPKNISTQEIKIEIEESYKFEFINRFIKEARFKDAKISTIDGLRADFKYGFGLIRCSNTSPYLILRFEACVKEEIYKMIELFKNEIQKIDIEIVNRFSSIKYDII